MRDLKVHSRAQEDLLEIWRYIAKDNVSAANRVGDEIDATIHELCQMPGIGHTRRDVKRPQYRFKNVFSYVIVYRYDDKTLTVIRVVHGRRNFRRLFR